MRFLLVLLIGVLSSGIHNAYDNVPPYGNDLGAAIWFTTSPFPEDFVEALYTPDYTFTL